MEIRIARREDLAQIISLLADDELGSQRETYQEQINDCYINAFERIEKEPNNHLIVCAENSKIIACMQLTFIPHLTFKGGTRAQIEAVRVHKEYRDMGIGKKLFEWAIDRAEQEGCHMLQLTTNKTRESAKNFYEAMGFTSTHEGLKLYLKEW